METKQALQKRKSIRSFTDQKVPTETIKELLTLAQTAPSWVNSQVQHVYVVTGQKLDQIKAAYQKAADQGQKGNSDIPMMSRTKWSTQGQANMQKWNEGLPKTLGTEWSKIFADSGNALYNVPTLLIFTIPKGYSEWSLYDLGAFGQNFLTAATDKGLATMTAYQFIKHPAILRQVLNIPDDQVIVIGIGVGYAKQDAPINKVGSERMPLDQFVTFED